MYKKYAEIDRQNYQDAHSDYKFVLKKNGPAEKKRTGQEENDKAMN